MDKVLKQRLVGASILIALAVIFLPMLFDSGEDERTQRQLALDLPDRPANGQREVRRLPLDPDRVRQPPPETVAEPPEQPLIPELDERPEYVFPDEEPTTQAQPEPEIETEPEIEPAAEPEPGPEPEAVEPSLAGNWVVQVAVFSNRNTADRIRDQLDGLGHSALLDVLVRDQADMYRLRTGPYGSREEAERARGQINTTIAGVDPVVRSINGAVAEDAPVERAGYSVQVGSFASRNNAERLVHQLDSQGHDAFMHSEESGGRTIWRVRVGSFAEREPAEALLAELREHAGLEGIVVTNP